MNRARSILFVRKPTNLRIWLCNSVFTQRNSFTNVAKPSKSVSNHGTFPQITAIQLKKYATEVEASVSQLDYENFCAETLDDLTDYIEELVESTSQLETADVVNKVSPRTLNDKRPFHLCMKETNFSWPNQTNSADWATIHSQQNHSATNWNLTKSIPFLFTFSGWCTDCKPWLHLRHIRDQQTNAKQANLAELTNKWPEALRLRVRIEWYKAWLLGLQTHWRNSSRATGQGVQPDFGRSNEVPKSLVRLKMLKRYVAREGNAKKRDSSISYYTMYL